MCCRMGGGEALIKNYLINEREMENISPDVRIYRFFNETPSRVEREMPPRAARSDQSDLDSSVQLCG